MLPLAVRTSSLPHTWRIRQPNFAVAERRLLEGINSPVAPWFLVIFALVDVEAFTVKCVAGIKHHRLIYPCRHLVVAIFATTIKLH